MEIRLVDHLDSDGNSFGQWYLYVDESHYGLVQKSSGYIHLHVQVDEDVRNEIAEEVRKQVGFTTCTISQPPVLPPEYLEEEGEEDEFEGDDSR